MIIRQKCKSCLLWWWRIYSQQRSRSTKSPVDEAETGGWPKWPQRSLCQEGLAQTTIIADESQGCETP